MSQMPIVSQGTTSSSQTIPVIARIGLRSLSALGYLLMALLILVICLPILLLPLTTAVPGWIWVLCALADVALIVLMFRMRPARRGITTGIAGTILVSLIAVIASQAFAATPPINGADGKPLPGSIATLEKVSLNGSEQWITIRGQDATKPILLHLGMGGPGDAGCNAAPGGPHPEHQDDQGHICQRAQHPYPAGPPPW